MIEVFCPGCGHGYRVAVALLGKAVRCPRCQKVFSAKPIESAAGAEPPLAPPAPPAQPQTQPAALAATVPPGPAAPISEPPAPAAAPPGPQALAEPLEPLPPPLFTPAGPQRARRWKKPALLVGAGVLGAGGLTLLAIWLVGLLFGPELGKFACYVPEKANVIIRLNLAELRKSDLFDDLKEPIHGMIEEEVRGLDIEPSDVEEFFRAGTEGGRGPRAFVTVLVTRDDSSLSAVVGQSGRRPDEPARPSWEPRSPAGPARAAGQTKSASGFDYVAYSRGYYSTRYVARTAKRTLCITDDEDEMKEVLDRVKRDKPAELSDEMRRGLKHVGQHSGWFVGHPPTNAGGEMIKVAAGGFTFGSTAKADFMVCVKNERYARGLEKVCQGAAELVAAMGEDISSKAKGKERETLEDLLKLIDNVRLSRSGDAVMLNWKGDAKELSRLIGDMRGMERQFEGWVEELWTGRATTSRPDYYDYGRPGPARPSRSWSTSRPDW